MGVRSGEVRSGNDVLIVGAGPTGLLLAGDLATAGVAVTVLERRTDESPWTRAFVVHARTLELLDAHPRGWPSAPAATAGTHPAGRRRHRTAETPGAAPTRAHASCFGVMRRGRGR